MLDVRSVIDGKQATRTARLLHDSFEIRHGVRVRKDQLRANTLPMNAR